MTYKYYLLQGQVLYYITLCSLSGIAFNFSWDFYLPFSHLLMKCALNIPNILQIFLYILRYKYSFIS